MVLYRDLIMKKTIQNLLIETIKKLQASNTLPQDLSVLVNVEYARASQYGDFATNVAIVIAKKIGRSPLEIAKLIAETFPKKENRIDKIEIAAPGFINFYLSEQAFRDMVKEVLVKKELYGQVNFGAGKWIMVEFVSANPTGPLHVGHGRGAAFGDTIASLLKAIGYQVHREYYVNDAGRQMHILALSIWLRYLEILNKKVSFPTSGYKGDYIIEISRKLYEEYENKFDRSIETLYSDLPTDSDAGGDGEFHVDAMVMRAKDLLGEQDYKIIFDKGITEILADIREDLEEFGVVFDEWFHESHLIKNHYVELGIDKLQQGGNVYKKDGALWFKATSFGDEKDRVLVRANGEATYFASDVGYHLNKDERGFERIIDILGADHHGYAPRIKGILQAMGLDAGKLEVLLVQFAILYRGKQKVSMSTRGGEFVTLRALREEVGNDAVRFFYIMRKNDQHLDFDLELAKAQSSDNPVYYIQYAHARICSVMEQSQDKQRGYDENIGLNNLHLLNTEHEKNILRTMMRYTDILFTAAINYEPHVLAYYLRELANDLHSYYNACQFLVDDENVRNARLSLINAVKHILANGLSMLGVSAPIAM